MGLPSSRSRMGLEHGAASPFISGMAALPVLLPAVSPSPGQVLITFYGVKAVGLMTSKVQGQRPQSAAGRVLQLPCFIALGLKPALAFLAVDKTLVEVEWGFVSTNDYLVIL